MPTEPRRGERLQIMLSPEELAALDDWRFDKRMPSRPAAVRELWRRGVFAEEAAAKGPHAGLKQAAKIAKYPAEITGFSNAHCKLRRGPAGVPPAIVRGRWIS